MAEKQAKSVTKAAKAGVKTKSGSTIAGKPKAGKTATKTAAKKAKLLVAAKKAPLKKQAGVITKPADAQKAKVKPTPEERYRMVQMAAYFIAEKHGFHGRSDEHWAAAERQVAAKLGQ